MVRIWQIFAAQNTPFKFYESAVHLVTTGIHSVSEMLKKFKSVKIDQA